MILLVAILLSFSDETTIHIGEDMKYDTNLAQEIKKEMDTLLPLN